MSGADTNIFVTQVAADRKTGITPPLDLHLTHVALDDAPELNAKVAVSLVVKLRGSLLTLATLRVGATEQIGLNVIFNAEDKLELSLKTYNTRPTDAPVKVSLFGSYLNDDDEAYHGFSDSEDSEDSDLSSSLDDDEVDDSSDPEQGSGRGRVEELPSDEDVRGGSAAAAAAAAAKKAADPGPSRKRQRGEEAPAGSAASAAAAAAAAAGGALSNKQRRAAARALAREQQQQQQQPPKSPQQQQKQQQQQQARPKSPAASSSAAAAAAAAAASPKQEQQAVGGARRFPNGLVVQDLRIGGGAQVKQGHLVWVKYSGTLTNGKVFDSSLVRPFKFRLGVGKVIPGWDQGIKGMKVGGRRRLTVPPKLAYGAEGAPPTIPRNATLNFDVTVEKV